MGGHVGIITSSPPIWKPGSKHCGMRLFQETRPATFHYIITDAFQGITSVLVSTTPRARTGSGTRFRDYGPPLLTITEGGHRRHHPSQLQLSRSGPRRAYSTLRFTVVAR